MILLKTLTSPICIIVLCLASCFFFLTLKKKERLALFLLAGVLLSLTLLSCRPFSNFLLWKLEKQYPPLSDVTNLNKVDTIVVLASWDSNNPTVPYSSNIGYKTALRVLEAHRLYKQCLHCRIIVSGGQDSTRLMKKLLLLLGVQDNKIVVEKFSDNTEQSAENVKQIISDDSFILVTSAIHLSRSERMFRDLGMDPIPAPADFLYGYYLDFTIHLNRPLSYFLPNIESFRNSLLALYEYRGMLWYNLKTKWKDPSP